MERKCEICGKAFTPANAKIKFCSDECRKVRRRQLVKANYEKNKELTIEHNNEIMKNAQEWIDEYRKSDYLNGNDMLANQLGISLDKWLKIPLHIRHRMTEKLLKEIDAKSCRSNLYRKTK